MKERPILFSAPMVQALLDGSKTQTRRVVKLRNGQYLPPNAHADKPGMAQFLRNGPYGIPGDQLWVRETWSLEMLWGTAGDGNIARGYEVRYRAGGEYGFTYEGPDSETDPFLRYYDTQKGNWRSSIHMPRWASRISLDITSVRVERLHDISPDDCIAEGVWPAKDRTLGQGDRAIQAYKATWENIHGPHSWQENPWVWVLTFTVKENSNG